MLLSEFSTGQEGILLGAPSSRLGFAFQPGGRITVVMRRPELSVVEVGGKPFALAPQLAEQIVVVRIAT